MCTAEMWMCESIHYTYIRSGPVCKSLKNSLCKYFVFTKALPNQEGPLSVPLLKIAFVWCGENRIESKTASMLRGKLKLSAGVGVSQIFPGMAVHPECQAGGYIKRLSEHVPHLTNTSNLHRSEESSSSVVLLRHLKMKSFVPAIGVVLATLVALEAAIATPVSQSDGYGGTGTSVGILMSDYTGKVQSLRETVAILRQILVSW